MVACKSEMSFLWQKVFHKYTEKEKHSTSVSTINNTEMMNVNNDFEGM